ncbi:MULTISPECIES: DUF1127 domain-containing protein [unclassified Rhizobium]|uniref:DUF1127 domain-containing protein n=1 Tax=unclassified Rhizobium TaxID=2613769 RepID=UPI00071288E8|nr:MULTISPECIES: DUF1127 domain-containing protein [unclassified Rhizobium]KQS98208.1 hypothetical protein ASG50_23865 [Rhizobium sp. Leaf386]KQT00471.1 hypothetical protein ASG42_06455 [Rhizobium sp. Leaf391]KQT97474.1 hypothetical protein ASG68_11185 [Rhizobium sp. Leaf453]
MSTICATDDAICSAELEAIRVSRVTIDNSPSLVRRAFAWLIAREKKRLSRIALAELTEDQLADIGVTVAEARREAARPYWD